MELIQKQVQALNQQLLQSLELLQMSTMELEEYLRDLAQENPMVELNEDFSEMEQSRDNRLLDRLNWLEDNDQQNYYYQRVEEEEFDPLARVGHEGGLEETLFRFISRQLYPLKLDEDTAQRVRDLAACLDQDGYLRDVYKRQIQGIADELILCDTNQELAEAQAKDLTDSAVYFPHRIDISTGGIEDLAVCDIVILSLIHI